MNPARVVAQSFVDPATADFRVLTLEDSGIWVTSEDARYFRLDPPSKQLLAPMGDSPADALIVHADQLIERGYRRVLVEELPSVLSQLAPWVTWHAQPASLDTWWSAWGAPRREVLWLVQELASASCSATELRLESHRGAIVTVGQPVAPAQLERFPAAIRPFLATHSTIEASESGFSAGLDINLDEDDFIAQASESGFDDLFPFIRRDETTYGVARTGEVLELSPANEGPAPHIVGDVGALVMHQLMQALFPDGRNEELHALRARLARARALT